MAAAEASGKKTGAICILALMAVSFIAYYPSLSHTFHLWDDNFLITSNERVMKGLSFDNIRWAFSTTYFCFYYPLTWLSHMTDVQLYGMDPGGHYLTNIILHSLNSALLFVFLFLSTRKRLASLLAAAVFSLHPMNVETAAWLAERKSLLATLFMILAMIFYLLRHGAQGNNKRNRWLAAACYASFMMGLMSKSSVVVFPVLLLLLDLWPLGRTALGEVTKNRRSAAGLVLEKWPLFILSLISGVLTLYAQQEMMAPLEKISFPQRIGEAFLGFWFYIEKFFLPVNLCTLYPHHQGGYPFLIPLLILAGMCALTALFFKLGRSRPALVSGWFFFIVSLLPVIGIIQVGAQAYADRYAYFAYWGLLVILLFGIPWERIFDKLPAAKLVASAAALAWLASLLFMTRVQLRTWKDDETLFKNVIRVSPGAAKGYYKLGDHYLLQGVKLEESLALFRKADELEPGRSVIKCDIGLAHFKLGEYQKAVDNFDLALGLEPRMALAYYNKGCALIKMNRGREALENLRLASEYGYDKTTVTEAEKAALMTYLGGRISELTGLEKWDEAEKALVQALDIDPLRADLWCYLGFVRKKGGDTAGAEKAYEKALAIDGSLDIALRDLAVICAEKDDLQRARELLEKLRLMRSRYADEIQAILDKK